jgi:hypothetical protein
MGTYHCNKLSKLTDHRNKRIQQSVSSTRGETSMTHAAHALLLLTPNYQHPLDEFAKSPEIFRE